MKKNSFSYKVGLFIGWTIVAAIATIVFLLLLAVIKALVLLVF